MQTFKAEITADDFNGNKVPSKDYEFGYWSFYEGGDCEGS